MNGRVFGSECNPATSAALFWCPPDSEAISGFVIFALDEKRLAAVVKPEDFVIQIQARDNSFEPFADPYAALGIYPGSVEKVHISCFH